MNPGVEVMVERLLTVMRTVILNPKSMLKIQAWQHMYPELGR